MKSPELEILCGQVSSSYYHRQGIIENSVESIAFCPLKVKNASEDEVTISRKSWLETRQTGFKIYVPWLKQRAQNLDENLK